VHIYSPQVPGVGNTCTQTLREFEVVPQGSLAHASGHIVQLCTCTDCDTMLPVQPGALHLHSYAPHWPGVAKHMLPEPLRVLHGSSPLVQGFLHGWQDLLPDGVIQPGSLHVHAYCPHACPEIDLHWLPGCPIVRHGSEDAQVSEHRVQDNLSIDDKNPAALHCEYVCVYVRCDSTNT
jgi:hypothetical protein